MRLAMRMYRIPAAIGRDRDPHAGARRLRRRRRRRGVRARRHRCVGPRRAGRHRYGGPHRRHDPLCHRSPDCPSGTGCPLTGYPHSRGHGGSRRTGNRRADPHRRTGRTAAGAHGHDVQELRAHAVRRCRHGRRLDVQPRHGPHVLLPRAQLGAERPCSGAGLRACGGVGQRLRLRLRPASRRAQLRDHERGGGASPRRRAASGPRRPPGANGARQHTAERDAGAGCIGLDGGWEPRSHRPRGG